MNANAPGVQGHHFLEDLHQLDREVIAPVLELQTVETTAHLLVQVRQIGELDHLLFLLAILSDLLVVLPEIPLDAHHHLSILIVCTLHKPMPANQDPAHLLHENVHLLHSLLLESETLLDPHPESARLFDQLRHDPLLEGRLAFEHHPLDQAAIETLPHLIHLAIQ